ncbi:DeoR/GlpR family DNA-binding transcription regulator [Azospirillum thermophilum]|uniref:DeoR family transcriptional regulator n=1 Tax=Azospirillum thermophilum TaxID=2202148 RepID=A0A2S2CZU8_9PROT|nr:DeoR/GlpR family DNA-binding transcription regulator [Azospirillum thermophilum]AWK89737.1 DeoR family transcriptional regulator [Azospirillum thermophilum]
MAMTPEERRKAIIDRVVVAGTVQLDALAEQLGVSRMTIHRDLDLLESRGLLRKQRGAATAESSLLFESNFHYRQQIETEEKRALARAAGGLILPGSVVMIDDSTTALALAEDIDPGEPVTIITNSAAAFDRLRGRPNLQLILTGGVYNDTLQGFYGLVCEQALGKLRADHAFVSASSVVGTALFHQDQEVVRAKRAMMASAKCRTLLLTPSKFGTLALNHMADLAEFDRILIAKPLDEGTVAALRQAGISFELV